jgi:hypothetical protein
MRRAIPLIELKLREFAGITGTARISAHPSALKDFAAPVATVFAASVAAWIALRLGKGQVAIARSQADIARDKLKFDLFENDGDEDRWAQLVEQLTGSDIALRGTLRRGTDRL